MNTRNPTPIIQPAISRLIAGAAIILTAALIWSALANLDDALALARA